MIAMGILDYSPAEMGFEGSGIIQAVGRGVSRLSVGDRALYMGSSCFSTYLTMKAALCVKIDDTMSYEQAAALPGVYATALMALVDKANLQRGQVRVSAQKLACLVPFPFHDNF
jgi:NADPH:quinone reductase-like Zn-dependent oxidoreductase